MKLLFCFPGLVDGFDSYLNGSDWLNHGVAILSSVLKNDGHSVMYLDLRKLKDWNGTENAIREIEFDVCLISIVSVDFVHAVRIAKIVKNIDCKKIVIVGGVHPTLSLGECLRIDEFDYIITHEGEVSLPILLSNIEYENGNQEVIKGIAPELDTIPFADRSLQPEGETPIHGCFKKPFFSITASRGCPGKCTFCQPSEREVFGGTIRKRSIDSIIEELKQLVKFYGMKSFMIHDDCFITYPSWVMEFCLKKEAEPLLRDLTFGCQARADMVCRRPEIMKELYEAGLRVVLVGFESGSNRVLEYLKKGVTVEQNLLAAAILNEIGIKVQANLMLGIPTETREEMRQTRDMVEKMKPYRRSIACYTPVPGSDLYEYCKKNDLLIMKGWRSQRRTAFSGRKIKGVPYFWVNWYSAQMEVGRLKAPMFLILTYIMGMLQETKMYSALSMAWRRHLRRNR